MYYFDNLIICLFLYIDGIFLMNRMISFILVCAGLAKGLAFTKCLFDIY